MEQGLKSIYITAEKYVDASIMTENRNLNMEKGETSKADVTQLQAGKQISIGKRDYVNMEGSVEVWLISPSFPFLLRRKI